MHHFRTWVAVIGVLAAGSHGWAQEDGRLVTFNAPAPLSHGLSPSMHIEPIFPVLPFESQLVKPPTLMFSTMFDAVDAEAVDDHDWRLMYRDAARSFAEVSGPTGLDIFFSIPDTLIESFIGGVRSVCCGVECSSLAEESETALISRVMYRTGYESSRRPFAEFMAGMVAKEQKYFAGFHGSSFGSLEYLEGISARDKNELVEDQRNILIDVSRRIYLGRTITRLDKDLRDDAFDLAAWRSVDYALGPVLLSGYVYLRGWEKTYKVSGLEFGIRVEPFRRIFNTIGDDVDDLAGATSLEIGVRSFPLKVIVSSGLHNGDMEMDFIGIGTSVAMARQAVRHQYSTEE